MRFIETKALGYAQLDYFKILVRDIESLFCNIQFHLNRFEPNLPPCGSEKY
jgi:hypothetical protein